MANPERQLWVWLDHKMHGHWVAQRIENEVGRDTPDVWFAMHKLRPVNGWLELKVLSAIPAAPASPLRLPGWSPGQRNWALKATREGALVWLVLKIVEIEQVFFVPAQLAATDLVVNTRPHKETLEQWHKLGFSVEIGDPVGRQVQRILDALHSVC